MKLIDLMVSQGIKWPVGYYYAEYAAQDSDGYVWFYDKKPTFLTRGVWDSNGHLSGASVVIGLPLAEDWNSCVVTKAQYDTVMSPPIQPEHPDVAAFKKWYADTLPVVEARAAGKVVEWYSEIAGTWNTKDFGYNSYQAPTKYRIKPEPPKTVNINGYEVPEPLRVAPAEGTPVYIAGVYIFVASPYFKWCDGPVARSALNAGLVHLTREAAELHSKALASFTQEGD